MNKWSTAYEPAFYTIYRINGSTIAARRATDGREICRDASHFKLANAVVQNMDGKLEAGNVESNPEERRESTLKSKSRSRPGTKPRGNTGTKPRGNAGTKPRGDAGTEGRRHHSYASTEEDSRN